MIRGELIEDLAVLEQYRDRWDRLAVELSSPFCAPAWALSWWRHAGPASARLRVIVALDGEELVGIAPFYFDRWGLRLRRYSFLGAEESWRVEPLARPERLDEVAAVFAEQLSEARPRPDVLRFHNVSAESPWPELLVRLWPSRRRPRLYHDSSLPSPTATLEPRPLDAWLGSKSRGFRQQVRRRRRQLEERGGVCSVSTTAGDLERDLDSFFSLHFGRWEKRGGSWAGRHGIEQAMRTAARELFDEARLRIACVRVEGNTIAAAVIISAGEEATYWLGGFDDRWAAQSPGILALVTAVEDALERPEEARFDLGPGEQDYKYRFADGEDQLRPVNVVPHSGRFPLVRLQLGARSLRVSLRERSMPVPGLRRSGELQSALH